MIEILSQVKSSSYDDERVEHLIVSSPVTVKVRVDELELPAPRSSVTTGGVLSAATVVVVVVGVVVVDVVAVVVVVDATVVVVLGATVVVVVVAIETIVQTSFLPDFAQTNFVPETVETFPAFAHFAPDRVSADAVKGCIASTANIKQKATIRFRARSLATRIELMPSLITMAQPDGYQI